MLFGLAESQAIASQVTDSEVTPSDDIPESQEIQVIQDIQEIQEIQEIQVVPDPLLMPPASVDFSRPILPQQPLDVIVATDLRPHPSPPIEPDVARVRGREQCGRPRYPKGITLS